MLALCCSVCGAGCLLWQADTPGVTVERSECGGLPPSTELSEDEKRTAKRRRLLLIACLAANVATEVEMGSFTTVWCHHHCAVSASFAYCGEPSV